MAENSGITMFIILFIMVYGLVNFFVLSMYARLFKIEKSYIFYILLVLLAFSYIIANILVTKSINSITQGIYYVAGTWMGVLFISFCLLLVYFIIDLITPITSKLVPWIILGIVLIVSMYSLINAEHLAVKEINIHTDKANNLRIVQITDLHLGPLYGKPRLQEIVDKVNSLNPDIVVITGDLIDNHYPYDKDLFKTLNNITSDVYIIGGNHEAYSGLPYAEGLLNNTKVRWVHDDVRDYRDIQLISIDDSNDKAHVKIMLEAMNISNKLDAGKYKILLYHRPTGWKDASRYVNLMLTGHTHAGQIWPFTYLSWIEGHAVYGIYRVNGVPGFMLYVSSGTGTWGSPMRLGSSTEITVFNIQKR